MSRRLERHDSATFPPILFGVTMNLLSWLHWLLALPSAVEGAGWTPASSKVSDALVAASVANQLALVSNGILRSFLATQDVSQNCTEKNAERRKEYTGRSRAEKLDYGNAMKRLMDAAAFTPSVGLF